MSRAILITGASGALAGLVTDMLAKDEHNELIGADMRALPSGRPFAGTFYQVRYTQRRMAEVFRNHKPDTLIHMGRIRGTAVPSLSRRFKENVMGTRNLLDLSRKHGVRRVIVMSTYHVYGAHQHNHVNIREDEPLRASQIFPELTDAVELDHAASAFLWRHRDVETVVLRPCNMIGPTLNNLISRLLRSRRCPRLLGYDPVMQFIDERDAARAIVRSVDHGKWGVYNVCGEGVIPYSRAIHLAGSKPLPVPHLLAYPFVGAMRRLLFPKHLMDYFRYPTVLDDGSFRETFEFAPEMTTVETLQGLRNARRHGTAG